jgi:hypothetical protein
MLAAAVSRGGGKPATPDIEAAISAQSPRFSPTRYPRANCGNTVRAIKEMTDRDPIRLAANAISGAIAAIVLPDWEWRLVTCITGAVVSADLWKHPTGVRWLLRPAVTGLRTRFGATFSLNEPDGGVEQLIDRCLRAKWSQPQRDAW